jgi:hypothetical protein
MTTTFGAEFSGIVLLNAGGFKPNLLLREADLILTFALVLPYARDENKGDRMGNVCERPSDWLSRRAAKSLRRKRTGKTTKSLAAGILSLRNNPKRAQSKGGRNRSR